MRNAQRPDDASPRTPDDADRFIERDGVVLRYRDEGQGPTLLFVHGWPLTLDMWQPQADALRNSCRIVRIDRRGFGFSGGTASTKADADDLLHLLNLLRIDRAVVVGMSQGARAAMVLASTAPSKVSALALDGAPALPGIAEDEREEEVPITRYQLTLREQGFEAVQREIAAHHFLQLRTRDAAIHRLLKEILDSYGATDLQTPERPPMRVGEFKPPGVPVLVINGTHDTARRREIGDALARLLPQSERAAIPNAGHLPNLDNPGAYNRSLLEFVERHFPTR